MDVSTNYNLIIGLRLVIHYVFDILRYLYKMNAFFFITFVLNTKKCLFLGKKPTTRFEGVSLCLSEIMILHPVDQLYRLFDKKATGDSNSCTYKPQFLLQVGKECAHQDKTKRPKMCDVVMAFKGSKSLNL